MSTFTPGDRVIVTDGPRAGQTGIVTALSMGMVRVVVHPFALDNWMAFFPDELMLDLAAEGRTALAAAGPYTPVAFVPGGRLPSRRTTTLTVGDVWAWDTPIRYTLTDDAQEATA